MSPVRGFVQFVDSGNARSFSAVKYFRIAVISLYTLWSDKWIWMYVDGIMTHIYKKSQLVFGIRYS